METDTTEIHPFIFQHRGRVLQRDLSAAEAPDDDDILNAVNRFALRPLARDAFAVFTLDLCNNRVDRHFSRFPEDELQKIDAMTPGRPLMERHDLRGTLPRGRFFRSRLHEDGPHISVRPDVYVLRTADNRDFILNIEAGVYRETSIGFSFRMPECSVCGQDLRTCAHIPGRTYDDEPCHFVMRGVIEVIEGSVVATGSQGTGFVGRDTAALGLTAEQALEQARAAYHRPIELNAYRLWADE